MIDGFHLLIQKLKGGKTFSSFAAKEHPPLTTT
jgi:hypothetical protein